MSLTTSNQCALGATATRRHTPMEAMGTGEEAGGRGLLNRLAKDKDDLAVNAPFVNLSGLDKFLVKV